MAELNLNHVDTTNLDSQLTTFSVDPQVSSASFNKENKWINDKATEQYGYYLSTPELKQAVDALAMWTTGRGWEAEDPQVQALLESWVGNGDDSAEAIFDNLLVSKKVFGDAFAEIVRDEKKRKSKLPINIKPLDPAKMTILYDDKGTITGYIHAARKKGGVEQEFKPHEILHLCNGRRVDEPHGISIITACKDVIDARRELMADWRKVLHRNVNPLRIIEYDSNDTSKRDQLKAQYKEAIEHGEVIVVPKGLIIVNEHGIVPVDPQPYIRYLENVFYQQVGIPKVVLGGSEEFTESSAK